MSSDGDPDPCGALFMSLSDTRSTFNYVVELV